MCPVQNASKKEVHMAKKPLAPHRLRLSGGVRDPSDPKHYPKLSGTEGAVGAAASKRTLSTPEGFKETLLVRRDNPKLRIGTQFPPGSYASPSSHPPICRGRIRGRPIRRMSVQDHRKQYRPTDLSRGTSRFRAALAGQEVQDSALLVSMSAKSAVHQS